jgi:hypothetical protein
MSRTMVALERRCPHGMMTSGSVLARITVSSLTLQ